MKSVTFLRNTWRKKDKESSPSDASKSTPHASRPELSSQSLSPPSSSRRLFFGKTSSRSASPTHSQRSAPPQRPPRPPSLDLFNEPKDTPTSPSSSLDMAADIAITPSPPMSQSVSMSSRSSSELDGVWNDFLSDMREDVRPSHVYPSLHRKSQYKTLKSDTVDAMLDPSTHSLHTRYHITGSTPHLPYVKPRSPDNTYPRGSEARRNRHRFFSITIPSPPPLRIRKKVPEALILRPTASIVPLPPSPASFSTGTASRDTTPLATPVTPTYPIISRKTSGYNLSSAQASLSPPSTPSPSFPNTRPQLPRVEHEEHSYFAYNHHRVTASDTPQRPYKNHTKFLSTVETASRRANPTLVMDTGSPVKAHDIQWGYAV
ncbi:hypothetical protein BDZ89DRAFT_1124991 [Hymenopellis radicata]|nr:hypothetical protein BDZ89DRAFT_1124991 [Hymenopellis radicata]